jgi:transcriptional regulator with XRE-family HTH domain
MAKVSRSHLNGIENGDKDPSADVLIRIATAYELSPMEVLAKAGKITPEQLFPKIDVNPEAKALRARLKRALSDPLLEELVVEEYRRLTKRRSDNNLTKDEAWFSAIRRAELSLTNMYTLNYLSAIRSRTLRWAKQANRRKRTTPDEAKNLIAELFWLYLRCRKMYRNLYHSCLKRYPPMDWV